MQIAVKLLSPTAKTPTYATDGSAGFDIYASEHAYIMGGSRQLVSTGLSLAVPDGYFLRICPRSGLATKGIDVGAGVVDADYRGEAKVLLINTGVDLFKVRPGDRIAQGLIMPVVRVGFEAVEALPDTVRGEGGFGSTGR